MWYDNVYKGISEMCERLSGEKDDIVIEETTMGVICYVDLGITNFTVDSYKSRTTLDISGIDSNGEHKKVSVDIKTPDELIFEIEKLDWSNVVFIKGESNSDGVKQSILTVHGDETIMRYISEIEVSCYDTPKRVCIMEVR